jgi:hypothetical protein
MTILPHDHILRFRFVSEARPDISHVVDLGAFDGFGECSCEDFQFRLLPALSRGLAATGTRCKHLLAARETLLAELIARITDGEP